MQPRSEPTEPVVVGREWIKRISITGGVLKQWKTPLLFIALSALLLIGISLLPK